MGRSVTRPISNWLTDCDFTIRDSRGPSAPRTTACRPRSCSRSTSKPRHEVVKAQRRFEMQVGPILFRNKDENMRNTLCGREKEKERKGMGEGKGGGRERLRFLSTKIKRKEAQRSILLPLLSSCIAFCVRPGFVTYYEFHARHFVVVPSRNIVTPTRLHPAAIVSNNGRVTVYTFMTLNGRMFL